MASPFAPPPGLNSDDTTFAAEGRWADGNNVRFRSGKPEPLGHQSRLDRNLGDVGAMHAWINGTATYVAYGVRHGTAGKLYGGGALGVPNDITPVGLTGVNGWTLANYGGLLLAAPIGGTLYQQDPTGALAAAEVTQAPDTINCILVTPERQVLAFGCNEEVSGTFNSRCIRGSDIEDFTDWTTTATNNAFEHTLENASAIVAARIIGPYVAVWTDTGLHLGQFVGDPGQTYRFDRVATNCGLLAPHAVTILGGMAYWCAKDRNFYRWTPGGPVEPIPCPIGKDFSANLTLGSSVTTAGYPAMGAVTRFAEVWMFYPDSRDVNSATGNTRYVAFNTIDGTWFRGQMERTAILDNGLLQAALSSSPGAYVATDQQGDVIRHEFSGGTVALAWHIQSADFYLDEGARRMMIRGVIPDFEDQSGDVSLTITMRDRPHSTAVTKGPFTLTTSTTKKDFRASGKLATVKFSATTTDGQTRIFARLGKPTFDMIPMGGR